MSAPRAVLRVTEKEVEVVPPWEPHSQLLAKKPFSRVPKWATRTRVPESPLKHTDPLSQMSGPPGSFSVALGKCG